MKQHDRDEAPLCLACRRIPVSHLTLDIPEPTEGWESFFKKRNVQVFDDVIGRPSDGEVGLG